MDEISSSDDGYVERERILSASTSATPTLEPHIRSTSTSSMPSVSLTPFNSTGRHRLLPQTPGTYRRSSSPRFLPTPPPLLSGTVNTVSDCSLHKWNSEQRSITPSGRRLPQTPTLPNNSIPLITDKNNASVKRQYSTTISSNCDNNISANNRIGNIGDNEWPSPTITPRKFSELRKFSQNDHNTSKLFEHFTCNTLQRLSLNKQQQQRRQQQQRSGKYNQAQYSFDHSSGTSTSTNAFSRSSSLSPSVEQVYINHL